MEIDAQFKHKIWDLIRGLAEHRDSIFRPIAASHGLTMMQARTLLEIEVHPGHTVGSLSKVLGFANGNASSLCKKLEESGFLMRCRDESDERIVRLALTEDGAGTLRQIEGELQARFSPVLARYDQKSLDAFENALCALQALLEQVSVSNRD